MNTRNTDGSQPHISWMFAIGLVVLSITATQRTAQADPLGAIFSGYYCSAVANDPYISTGSPMWIGPGQLDVNTAPSYRQNDLILVDNADVNNANLCASTAGAHVIGGFGDYPYARYGASFGQLLASQGGQNLAFAEQDTYLSSGSPMTLASDGSERDFAAIEYYLAWAMDVGSSGTTETEFGGIFSNLSYSLPAYGNLPGSVISQSSGRAPTLQNTNQLADPICQGIWNTVTPYATNDYMKTQYEVNVVGLNINPVKVFGYTVAYSVDFVDGHFIPLSAVWPSQGLIGIDDRQEGWPLSWQGLGWETLVEVGITTLNHVGTVSMPEVGGNIQIILDYTQVTVQHGGRCPAGQRNTQGTCQ